MKDIRLFKHIRQAMVSASDMPDGAWYAMHIEAVNEYNSLYGASYDWYDVQIDYFEWVESRQKIIDLRGTAPDAPDAPPRRRFIPQ